MHADTYIRYENDAMSFEYDAKTGECKYSWAKTASRWIYKRTKIAYILSEKSGSSYSKLVSGLLCRNYMSNEDVYKIT